jgi:hypothetical protein
MELGEKLSNLRSKISSFFKALIAALLLGFTQTIPSTGVFLGPMVVPLFFFALGFPNDWYNFNGIFSFHTSRLIGGIIFYIGIAVFSVALLQWFWFRYKKQGLFTRGL